MAAVLLLWSTGLEPFQKEKLKSSSTAKNNMQIA